MKVVVSRTIKKIVKMSYKDDALYVVANVFLSRGRLKEIIKENIDWINSRKREHQGAQKEKATDARNVERRCEPRDTDNSELGTQQLIKDVFAGRKTMVLGDIIKIEPSMSTKTYLDGNSLYVAEKYYYERDLRLKAIKSYLKKIAFLFVANEVSSYGTNVSRCPVKIEFKDLTDEWCKCSLATQKILCFDYRIAQLPQNLRNYIIAHAFAHFQYSSHDETFWNHISNVAPYYEDIENKLKAYEFLREV